MAEKKLKEEIEQITEHIKQGHNFLLSGGAGSGKTYTLVQTIRIILNEYPSSLIACITYTNAAVKEISRRVNNCNLIVSTIHDFLWDNIKNYQVELRKTIIELLNTTGSGLELHDSSNIPENFYDTEDGPIKIEYREYTKLKEGIISHDEVITIANAMFKKYPKLCNILKSRYPFILIDEYQDTFPEVIEILLRHLKKSNKKSIIGFFGDSMQCIYDKGIGNLNGYKKYENKEDVFEIQKIQNRRNPISVIALANKIRTDGLTQEPSEDLKATNMLEGKPKQGQCLFIYTDKDGDVLQDVRNYLTDKKGWNFKDAKKTKELNLTHNLIAEKAGFSTLMEIYNEDGILKYIKSKINNCVKKFFPTEEYTGKNFGEILTLLKSRNIDVKEYKATENQQSFIDSHKILFEKTKDYDYLNLCNTYVNISQLVDDKKQDEDEESKTGSKRSPLVKHLCNIEHAIRLYRECDISEFLNLTGYTRTLNGDSDRIIKSVKDKKTLRESIETLEKEIENSTIKEVIRIADEKRICIIDDKLKRYKEKVPYIYDRLMEVKYQEFINLYNYLEGQTPFSTQHKTKGTEFDNVLVILDNGKWNNYNFEKLFTSEDRDTKVIQRTENIFYVCCTRAKERLTVFFHKPSKPVIEKAIKLFGIDNVIRLEDKI